MFAIKHPSGKGAVIASLILLDQLLAVALDRERKFVDIGSERYYSY